MTHALRLYFPPAAVQRGKRMDSAFAGAWTGALPRAVLQFSFPAFAPLPISPYAPLALPDAAQRFMQSVLRALRTQHLLWQAWHLYFRQISQIQENIMATAKTPSKKSAAKAEAEGQSGKVRRQDRCGQERSCAQGPGGRIRRENGCKTRCENSCQNNGQARNGQARRQRGR